MALLSELRRRKYSVDDIRRIQATLKAGQWFEVITPGAGGYGPPSNPPGYGPAAATGGYAPAANTGGYAPAGTTGGYGPPSNPPGYGPAASTGGSRSRFGRARRFAAPPARPRTS